jgi:hypothetical protein
MIRQTLFSVFAILILGGSAAACKAGGVGDPCIPNDEFAVNYEGAKVTEVQIEDRSFQCETRVCLVKNFQGRVTCPFGNPAGNSHYDGPDKECMVPGTNAQVTAAVKPQCKDRKDAVYCSCRCDGTDSNAKYCECPDGYECKEVVNSLDPNLVRPGDKYCVKKGDNFDKDCAEETCDVAADHCGYSSNMQEL